MPPGDSRVLKIKLFCETFRYRCRNLTLHESENIVMTGWLRFYESKERAAMIRLSQSKREIAKERHLTNDIHKAGVRGEQHEDLGDAPNLYRTGIQLNPGLIAVILRAIASVLAPKFF